MFEELIKINRNGYSRKNDKPFPVILGKLVDYAHTLYIPLLIFALTSLVIGILLSYLTLLLDFYKSIIGRWITFYIIFLLVTPSLILFVFCYQLARMMKTYRKYIGQQNYKYNPRKLSGSKLRQLFTAFKEINRIMIHYKGQISVLSGFKLMEQPLFYYTVIVSMALSISYFAMFCLLTFGVGVWYFYRPL